MFLSCKYTLIMFVTALCITSCRRDMQDQPKYKPLQKSEYFADGRASRPTPPNTIARDEGGNTDVLHTGLLNGHFAEAFPLPVTADFLQRGEDRYNIFCSPCHGMTGTGDGMVHRRGFWIPPSLHTTRLQNVPHGYLFQVINNGYGAMSAYADQIVEVKDRWAIVAYIRVLEISRDRKLIDLPRNIQEQLQTKGSAPETSQP